ncbi:hypothetical protein ARSEF4850_007899 [Beauveria asiatica]
MSLSDYCTEESSTQRSGFLADFPILIASSPASPVSSRDTLSVQGTEELEAIFGLDTISSVATPSSSSSRALGGTATIPSADNEDRIRVLMAKYEQVMNGDVAQTGCISSEIPANLGNDGAVLLDSRGHDDRSDDKPTKTDVPQGNPTLGRTRRDKKVHSAAQGRVQKRSATVSRRQAYAFERLGGARRATSGAIEFEVYWAPTWLPFDHLTGDDAIQEAKDLVVDVFGSITWHEEVRKQDK